MDAQLIKDLPQLSGKNRERVSKVILGSDIDCSMDDLAISLLASGISVGHLLATMLRCEWISMQALIATSEPEDVKQQVKLFSGCIEHFNALQESIIAAADNSWRTALDNERRSRVLAECKIAWFKTKTVQLHNYFEEMPVSAKVDFLGFDENRLRVRMTAELARVFSATLKMNTALISSFAHDFSLIVRKDYYNGDELSLLLTDVESSGRDRRNDVRVRLSKPLTAVIDSNGKHVNADIVDISCSGIGMVLEKGQQLAVDDVVRCSFQIGSTVIDHAEGTVCWLVLGDRKPRAGIKFSKGKVKRELIYKFLFVQEQEIISRLRRLPPPDWMSDKS